ncbi:SDR family NAD(P)-dependent oxidoreductase [Sphingopyxis macrogoltabida]|uniref:Oxidoreductase n=1 Tax=Sphingopyxis macrogoltabida TaxID=33050 RepID=A0AAC8YZ51_SPHMC|nr:SDR family NAD(P)-dependent oxidoreductase [Sphingopyxis macrogoltabida]ALJ13591.1 oxidoreductase [Sphingopyxis macrogoltabida]AMU88965.1 oxidoreductase [Sphingopyxis macrogoltabida]
MSGRFATRSVLVTGAGSGIGRATARLFAGEGAKVLATDIGDGLVETADSYPDMLTMCGDAGNEQRVADMVQKALEEFGALDVAVANAGISGGMAGIFDQTQRDWEEVLRVNLIGAFLAIKHTARAMVDAGRGGVIICTASVAGLRAGAGGAAYSASKAGVINLVQTAAQQLGGTGIRVNAVCPGLIETGMTHDVYQQARARGREEAIGQLNPLRRGGAPDEIARAIAFLASDEASYINGQALPVDGGLCSSLPFSGPRRLGEARF